MAACNIIKSEPLNSDDSIEGMILEFYEEDLFVNIKTEADEAETESIPMFYVSGESQNTGLQRSEVPDLSKVPKKVEPSFEPKAFVQMKRKGNGKSSELDSSHIIKEPCLKFCEECQVKVYSKNFARHRLSVGHRRSVARKEDDFPSKRKRVVRNSPTLKRESTGKRIRIGDPSTLKKGPCLKFCEKCQVTVFSKNFSRHRIGKKHLSFVEKESDAPLKMKNLNVPRDEIDELLNKLPRKQRIEFHYAFAKHGYRFS